MRDELLPGALLATFACALGVGAWWSLPIWGEAEPRRFYGHGIFYFLFARDEPLALALCLGIIALLWWLTRGERFAAALRVLDVEPRRFAVVMAGGVFAIALLGSFTVTQGFPLAMDEFMPRFQAEIFRAGKLLGVLPDAWRGLTQSISPILSNSDPAKGTIMSAYFPMYSLVLAMLGPLTPVLNPGCAAGSVLLISGCAAALWNEPRTSNAATLLLATSPQLLINAMTGYPLAGNLLLNLLWLRLLLMQRVPWAMLLAPLSVFALLFHQPTPHALFAFPLGVGLLLRRKHAPWLLVWHTAWAGFAYWAVTAWLQQAQSVSPPSGVKHFGLPDSWAVLIQSINVSLLATWGGVAMLMLAPLAVFHRPGEAGSESGREWLPELALGAALCFGFYFFFLSHQGHGWGYRYFFPALGNVALLAAAGFRVLEGRRGAATAAVPVVAGALASLILLLPLRAAQVASFVAPYAKADRAIEASGAELVLIDGLHSWYGGDLVRNDPFLHNRTKRALAERMGSRVPPVRPDRVLLLDASALRSLGVPTRVEAGDFTLRLEHPSR